MAVVVTGGGGGGAALLLGNSLTPNQGTTEAATGINSVPPAYTQMIAALASQATGFSINGSIVNGGAAATKAFFQLAIGAAGSEQVIASGKYQLQAAAGDVVPISFSSNQLIAAGTRLAYRCWVEGAAAGTVMFGWTIPRRA